MAGHAEEQPETQSCSDDDDRGSRPLRERRPGEIQPAEGTRRACHEATHQTTSEAKAQASRQAPQKAPQKAPRAGRACEEAEAPTGRRAQGSAQGQQQAQAASPQAHATRCGRPDGGPVPRRQWQQRGAQDVGTGGHPVSAPRAGQLCRRHCRHAKRAAAAQDQQPRVQRSRPEPLQREQALAMGLGLGTVHRPRHRPARRDAGRGRGGSLRLERSPGAVRERPRPDGLQPHAGGARHRHQHVQPAPADQHQQQRDRREPGLRQHGRAPGLAEGAQRLRPPAPGRRPATRVGQARRPGDGPDGAADGQSRRRNRGRRRACQRERRADVDSDPVRAGAQSHCDALPKALSPDVRFEIARRVVGAEIQRITYAEFLPAVGVRSHPTPATSRASIRPSRTSSRPSASAPTAWCTENSSRPSRRAS